MDVDGSVGNTGGVVGTVVEEIVDWGPGLIVITEMGFVVKLVEEGDEGLVEGVDSGGDFEVVVVLGGNEALHGWVKGNIEANDEGDVLLDFLMVTSGEGTGKVVTGGHVLEVTFS